MIPVDLGPGLKDFLTQMSGARERERATKEGLGRMQCLC